jgi:hypothetical protein
MSPQTSLTTLTIIGVLIGFSGGLISQISRTTVEDGSGKKVLTAAGKLAMLVSVVGFLGSFSSEILKAVIASNELASKTLEHTIEIERQRSEDEWRRQTSSLTSGIYNNTKDQLAASAQDFSATLKEFRNQENEILRANADINISTVKLITAIGSPTVSLELAARCDSGPYRFYCHNYGGNENYPPLEYSTVYDRWTDRGNIDENFEIFLYSSSNLAEEDFDKHSYSHCDIHIYVLTEHAPSNSILNARAVYATGGLQITLNEFRIKSTDIQYRTEIRSFYELRTGAIIIRSDDGSLSDVDFERFTIDNQHGQAIDIWPDSTKTEHSEVKRCARYNSTKNVVGVETPVAAYFCKIGEH